MGQNKKGIRLLTKAKAVLYTVLAFFLGLFGLSNIAPNTTVGQMTGQHITQTSQTKTVNQQQKAPNQTPKKTQSQPIVGREPSDGVVRRNPSTAVWKPGKSQRKKHKNLLHVKHAKKRKRIRKRKK